MCVCLRSALCLWHSGPIDPTPAPTTEVLPGSLAGAPHFTLRKHACLWLGYRRTEARETFETHRGTHTYRHTHTRLHRTVRVSTFPSAAGVSGRFPEAVGHMGSSSGGCSVRAPAGDVTGLQSVTVLCHRAVREVSHAR